MTVVFEVLSPKNSVNEMADKLAFYDEHGVQEYYLFDPDSNRLHAYLRRTAALVRERKVDGLLSPRLGIRFDLSGPEMVVRRPDGQPFLTFEQLQERTQLAEQRLKRLGELSRRLMEQQITPEERQELERLLQSSAM